MPAHRATGAGPRAAPASRDRGEAPLVSWLLVPGWRASAAVLAGACAVVGTSGCGAARQDAREVKGDFAMEVVKVSFPKRQSIARPASLELQVRNVGSRTAPSVAVAIDSFYYTEDYPELASTQRPVWVIEQGPGTPAKTPVQSQAVNAPGGAETAYVNTWTLGALAPGQTQTFVWRVTPVRAGMHTVHFTIAAGLAGRARAQTPSGAPVQGALSANIAALPPSRHVDPKTGRVVSGPFPLVP
jgi:hypothetical protein